MSLLWGIGIFFHTGIFFRMSTKWFLAFGVVNNGTNIALSIIYIYIPEVPATTPFEILPKDKISCYQPERQIHGL